MAQRPAFPARIRLFAFSVAAGLVAAAPPWVSVAAAPPAAPPPSSAAARPAAPAPAPARPAPAPARPPAPADQAFTLPEPTPPRLDTKAPADAAVVVGIEDYVDLVDVPFAERDASLFQQFLQDTAGVEPGRISNLHQNPATREAILREVKARADQVGPGGTLWVYFSGHGSGSAKGGSILLGRDATATHLAERAVDRDELVAAARVRPEARGTVLVIDACFSGKTRDGQNLTPDRFAVPASLAVVSDPRTLVWTGATGDQFAGPLPGTRHGLFTYFLVGALSGWAADTAGEVRLDAAGQYVAQAMGAAGNAVGRRQTPELTRPSDATPWVLSRPGAGRAGPDLRELSLKGTQGFGRGLTPLPPVPTIKPMTELPHLSLKDVDVEALSTLERAVKADRDPKMEIEEKARVWDAVVAYPNMDRDRRKLAEDRAAALRALKAAQIERAGQIQMVRGRFRDDRAKLAKLVTIDESVVSATQKDDWRRELTEAYAPWKDVLKDLGWEQGPEKPKGEDKPGNKDKKPGSGGAGVRDEHQPERVKPDDGARETWAWVSAGGSALMLGASTIFFVFASNATSDGVAAMAKYRTATNPTDAANFRKDSESADAAHSTNLIVAGSLLATGAALGGVAAWLFLSDEAAGSGTGKVGMQPGMLGDGGPAVTWSGAW